MANSNFEIGSYYHIYNRGVDKRNVFLNPSDYARFIHYLYVCNDEALIDKTDQRNIHKDDFMGKQTYLRKKLTDIMCFVLMPNHFHMLMKERRTGGISQFMQKVGTGYTMYFNAREDRTGALFQGKFKSVEIISDKYLLTISRYIHLNPLALFQSDWKSNGVKNLREAKKYLGSYKWSSLPDYIGKKNFPSVINKKLHASATGIESPEDYCDFIYAPFSEEDMPGTYRIDEI